MNRTNAGSLHSTTTKWLSFSLAMSFFDMVPGGKTMTGFIRTGVIGSVMRRTLPRQKHFVNILLLLGHVGVNVPNMAFKQNIGRRLKTARVNKGLTQAHLAKRAGMSQDWVCSIERGHRRPDLTTLMQLAKALSVSLDYLCGQNTRIKHAKGN